MVLPTDIRIKEEYENFESNPYDAITREELKSEYEIKIEVDVTRSDLNFNEFTVKNEVIETELDTFEDSSGLCYEDLVDYCVLTCVICNQKFCEGYSLLRHNLQHLRLHIKPLDLQNRKCTTCDQYFIDQISRDEHIKLVHGSKYERVSDAEENFKTTKMMHQCKICGKIQTYKNWHSHMKEVHTEKKYECSICDAKFKCRRYIRRHMETHLSMEKPTVSLPCPQCPALLKCKNALTTHIRNCHSEQVQCKICFSVLKCQSYLNSHMRRVHYVDGKDHQCHCGKIFRSSRYLKIHIKNAHEKR